MGESLWIGGVTVVILVGSMSMLSMIFHKDLIKGLLQNLGFIAIPAFVAWFGFMVWNAGNKGSTLFVFIASGILGVIALEHPSVRGSAQAMTPLLSGLFGLPILLSTLIEKRGKRVVTVEPVSERAHPEIITWMGMSFGLLSVALPGLGTSSLVSVGQNLTKDDAQYLRMSSLAESIGELIALTLGILMIADRSSDAAVISRIVTAFTGEYSLTPTFTWAMLATLISATWVGLRLVPVLGIPYRFLMYVIPNKVQSIAVAVGMLWVVWSHTGSWGLGITAAGTMIHFGARQLGVPNQAFFACMVIPMCLSMFEIRVW
jgi:TctA family transporter